MIQIDHFNILLADDEKLLRQSLVRSIEELGDEFVVTAQADNGRDALELLKTQSIHVVITDIRMPVMDGLELARKIHAGFPEILVVILTGYADFDYAQDAIRCGVRDYLLKPVTEESLSNTLTHLRLILEKTYSLPEEADAAGLSPQESVRYATHYMREHYMEEIDISEIASLLGFTSAYLTRLFNRYAGETPLKHLTGIRINEARRLLTESDLTISEVGRSVGYPDQFHFSKTFRKLTGMNPTAYRRQTRTEGEKNE